MKSSATEYKYKELLPQNFLILKKLLEVFSKSFNDPKTYEGNAPSDNYLHSLLEKPDFISLVALHNNEVVGGLTAYVLEKPEQDQREIYIYDLAVSETHRRHGIATNLINELKNIAKKRNVYVIFVQADQEDKPAIKLYEALGKKETVYQFDITVEQDK